jgi:hypothetical protein
VSSVVAHAFEAVTHLDGRLLRTLKDLMFHPGMLTAACTDGPRRRYFAPFQVFLLANIVFFLVQSLLGFHSLSNALASHIGEQGSSSQIYSALAHTLVDRRLAATDRTLAEYRDDFDAAVSVNAKALAVVLVPVWALLALITFVGARRPFAVYLVFALHFGAFFLLFDAIVMPVIGAPLDVVMKRIGRPELWDPVLSAGLVAVLTAYWALAARRAFGVSRLGATLKSLVMLLAFTPTIIAYRFVVFLVTLYTT